MVKLIILGKTPPPIGGVTIHVQRLLDLLDTKNINYIFYKNTKINLLKILFLILFLKHIVHLHTSSPLVRFYLSFINRITHKSKIIITYHGNIGRFNFFKNWLDTQSIKLADIPIVINEESFRIAKTLNSNTKFLSAFIPPLKKENLPNHILKNIRSLKKEKNIIFCTNAFDVSYDKNGKEIYNGTQILKIFSNKKNQQYGFIFSDPSSNYKRLIKEKKISLTNNILMISEPHSFFEVLKHTDCFIRHTTTDGDPLSIKESLYLKKIVLATNVVKRAKGVITYHLSSENNLQKLIHQVGLKKIELQYSNIDNGGNKLINLYSNYI
jgi:hypothetical protein